MKKTKAIQLFFLMGLAINGCEVLAADGTPKISEEDAKRFPISIAIATKYLAYKKDDKPYGDTYLGEERLIVTSCHHDKGNNSVNMTVKTEEQIAARRGGIPHMSFYPKAKLEQLLIPKIVAAHNEQLSMEESMMKQSMMKQLSLIERLTLRFYGTHPKIESCKPIVPDSYGGWKDKYRSLDNGVQCCVSKKSYIHNAELECNIALPTRIYDALEIMIAHQKSSPPRNVSTTLPHENNKSDMGQVVAPKKAPAVNAMPRPQFCRAESCSPTEQNMCYTLLKALVESKKCTIQESENTVNIKFNIPFSKKLEGYTTDTVVEEIKKHGDTGLPSEKMALICKDDVSSIATWFFWQHSHRKKAATGQYFFGKDGKDGELFLGHPTDSGVAGDYVLSKEAFEEIKAAN